jgi:two-component system chemotaxis sensor kinase CheA
VDLAKYRTIFIEESTEHFAEISRALLELEKDPAATEAIDTVFRMAHSIKGMAASLEYAPIETLAHAIEDRMQEARSRGRIPESDDLSLLFGGLAELEAMLEAVVQDRALESAPDALLAELSRPAEADGAAPPEPAKRRAEKSAKRPAKPEASAQSSEPAGSSGGVELATPRPPPTVRVRTETLDRFLSTVGEVILNASQVRTRAAALPPTQSPELGEGLDRMDRVVGELQRSALELRTTRLLRIVEPLPRAARELAKRAGKQVEVEIEGAELEVDRSILDRLSDPLVHLIRNAVDHGIESPEARRAAGKPEVGHIAIEAVREKDDIRISVRDDGAGLDLAGVLARAVEAGVLHADLAEDLPPDAVAALVFEPGLSTARQVSEISGRGVGMDAVRATIESLGGGVELRSEPGRGTTTSLVVPITAAVQRVLILGLGEELVAFPISRVERILEVPAEAVERSGSDAFTLIEDELVPVIDLAGHVGLPAGEAAASASLLLTDIRGERVALATERIVGQQQIYVKPLPDLLAGVRSLAGLTILGDGRPIFLLDPNQIA